MNTRFKLQRIGLTLSITIALGLALGAAFGQPGGAAHAQGSTTSTYTLSCFTHPHFAGDPPQLVAEHNGQYTIRWDVSDGASAQFNLITGIDCLAGSSVTLTVTQASAGAAGFSTAQCVMSHTQECAFNIPVTGGGSVSGIPNQPTLSVPAGQVAVLNVDSDVVFQSLP